jgi:ribosomal-protein-alanine N-acetyltransferase
LEAMEKAWDTGVEYQWVVLERQTAECVGTVSLRVRGHAADFGYFFGKSYWGRGLAFEAMSAVMSWVTLQPDILRIWATADAENLRSRRLLERLNLQLEGVMRCATMRPNIGNLPRDTAIYALTRSNA